MRQYRHAVQVTASRTTQSKFFDLAQTETIAIRTMRVQFTIEKSLESEPNKAELTLTNLAPSTRDALCRKPLIVSIAAGYDGEYRHLFTGDLQREGETDFGNVDRDTTLHLADGDRAYRFARVSRSYKPGTSIATVLRDVASSMSLRLPRTANSAPELLTQFNGGYALNGASRDELTRLLAPYGMRWSIQNGQLQILKDDDIREELQWNVNRNTGMVGSPQWAPPEKSGGPAKLTIVSRIYPQLTPGGRINLQSERITGVFRVERVTHSGDSHGEEWNTTVEAKPLRA